MLTPAWAPMEPHEKQSAAWRTRARFVHLPCGRGSGKSVLAKRRIVRFLPVKKRWKDPRYFYVLPTMQQARRNVWDSSNEESLLRLIPDDWIADKHETNMTVTTVFGSTLVVAGMDAPQRLEGPQWDGGVVDESCDQKPGILRTILPMLTHRHGWLWRIGVPKRFGIGATEFRAACDRGLENKDPHHVTLQWGSESVFRLLGKGAELDYMASVMDARDFREQFNASWESSSGGIFHAFGDMNINAEKPHYDRDLPICVGSDFNVNPMSWVIGHQRGDEIHVHDQLFIRDTNTPAALTRLHDKYSSHESGWEFYGDATGQARKSAASMSDYLHIKNDSRFKGARVFYPAANPPRVDRFAATNAMLCNAAGRRRLLIHPRCENLIADLRARVWKDGAREPDDYGDIGHMSDAIGYWVHRRFPVRYELEAGTPTVHVEAM